MDILINEVYKDIMSDYSRYKVIYGSAGSGKSHFITQHLLIRMLFENNSKFLVIRKFGSTLANSVYQLFCNLISSYGLNEMFIITRSPLKIICKLTNSQIVFTGIDDPEKLKSIAGITSIFIEEATELNAEDFNQIDLRLRDVQTYKQEILIAFNPVSKQNWCYKRFFEVEDPKAFVLKTTYMDNLKFLSKEYIEYLENLKNIDERYYNIYVLGEFGTAGGLVFPKPFQTIPFYQKFDKNNMQKFYGLDFGYHAPSALVGVYYDRQEDMYYVETILYKNKLTTSQIIEIMKENKIENHAPIYCDSAEPDRITEIKRAGYNAKPASKSVSAGISFINGIHKKIKIYSDLNYDLLNEIKDLSYKKDKKTGEFSDEIDSSLADHAVDAMRYAFYTHLAKGGSSSL